MGITYPSGIDTFPTPSAPETTSLSSAGSADRAHVEHHRDLGAGLTAVMTHAAKKLHAHTGSDGTGKLTQANTHESADTDVSATSIHHSLGLGEFQAMPGNHLPDYNTLPNIPYRLCTSSTRPPMPYRGLQIYETDTDRVRVWASFGATASVAGLNTTVNFDGTGVLDPAEWAVSYDSGDAAHGSMRRIDGQLVWVDQSNWNNRAIAHRVKAEDRTSLTDDVVIVWKSGTIKIEGWLPFTQPASNDVYLRMSADEQSYWRLQLGNDKVSINYTTSGRDNEVNLGAVWLDANNANVTYRGELTDRTFTIFYMGQPLASFTDRNMATDKGANFREWGVGMRAGERGLGQCTPGSVDWISFADRVYYVAENRWAILPIANIPSVRLRQGFNQAISPSGSFIEWREELEDSFDFFDKTLSATEIVIKEPGLYQIDAAIQWNPNVVPDTGFMVFCVNGIETTLRTQQYMRGGGLFNPGFSQTMNLTGKIRFNTDDRLSLKVRFTEGGLTGAIFSWFDGPSKVNSRLDVTFDRV